MSALQCRVRADGVAGAKRRLRALHRVRRGMDHHRAQKERSGERSICALSTRAGEV